MKTDDLIDTLVADLAPAPPKAIGGRMAVMALAGGAAALGLLLVWLGVRPDLTLAVAGAMFWMKAGYACVLALAGLWAVERLARPAGSARGGIMLGLSAIGVLLALGAMQMMTTPEEQRMAVWLGASWRQCPIRIVLLSIPTLVLTLLALRRLAPTRLALAGAAAGLFAGGVATMIYGLHCPETTRAFVATWYSLGVALSAGLGAAVGPFVLRWR